MLARGGDLASNEQCAAKILCTLKIVYAMKMLTANILRAATISRSATSRAVESCLAMIPLAVKIVRAVRAAISVPLTVKMRSGFSADNRNAPELAWRLQEEGAEAITIHWRTREDRYGGTRAVDKIAETVARLQVPVIGNGDVIDIPSAVQMVRDTGCAGVMVGRGAMRNPWALRQIAEHYAGHPITTVDAAEKEGQEAMSRRRRT